MNVLSSPLHIMGQLSSILDFMTYNSAVGGVAVRPGSFNGRAFDVDPETGFFPPQPLPRLAESFELWERTLEEAKGVVRLGDDQSDEAIDKREDGERWRDSIRNWPVLGTDTLRSDMRLLQRAHMVLASVLHYYAHSIPPAEAGNRISIPRPLAVPLVEISNALGLPPVLTFADIVLWNWDFINPDLPLSVDNIRHLVIFSGTTAEDEFYHASAAAELKGVEMLKIMEGFMNMPNLTDRWAIAKVARDLERLKKIIEEIEVIVQGSRETVDPHIFYWLVRPWWSGSEERSPWVYEGVPDCPLPDLDGPSAGQSSVMHALDLFLDVDHTLQKKRQPAPSAQNRRADQRFMERMRRYMPRQHRDYLSCIAARSIRQVAERTPSLKDPYNAAVAALKKFRDGHIRIAVLYVVTMANSSPPAGFEHRAKRHGEETGPARGSGGTEVSNLLKAGRDATQRTLLK